MPRQILGLKAGMIRRLQHLHLGKCQLDMYVWALGKMTKPSGRKKLRLKASTEKAIEGAYKGKETRVIVRTYT